VADQWAKDDEAMTLKAHEGGPEIDPFNEILPRKNRHVTGKMPESVAIVSLGPSHKA